MKVNVSRLFWNMLIGAVLSVIIVLVNVPNIADIAERFYRVPFSVADGLVSIRRNNLFFFLIPLTFILACFYSNRELFYDQFVIRFQDMRVIWKIQVKELTKLSALYAFVFNAAGIITGLYYSKILCNWDQAESLCFILSSGTVKLHPALIIAGSFLLSVLVLMIYSMLFFLLIWRLSSPIGALFLCAAVVAADLVAYATEVHVFPSGLLSNDYTCWNTGMLLRTFAAIALIVILYWFGTKAVRKKEFL